MTVLLSVTTQVSPLDYYDYVSNYENIHIFMFQILIQIQEGLNLNSSQLAVAVCLSLCASSSQVLCASVLCSAIRRRRPHTKKMMNIVSFHTVPTMSNLMRAKICLNNYKKPHCTFLSYLHSHANMFRPYYSTIATVILFMIIAIVF